MNNNLSQIGFEIKQLRKQAGLTGTQLARKLGMSQAKLSNIETGKQRNLDSQQLATILNALKASAKVTEKLLLKLESSQEIAQSTTHAISRWSHERCKDLEDNSALIQAFLFALPPSMLQTLDYRAGLLKRYGVDEPGIQLDAKRLLTRQDLLWDSKKTFDFVLHETALYTTPAGRAAQLAQLDRLERMMRRPNIKLGIIPLLAGGAFAEHGNFVLYDNKKLAILFPGMDLFPTNDLYLSGHQRAFQELASLACYEDEAKALIRKAITHFNEG